MRPRCKALRPYVEAGRSIEDSWRRTTRTRVGADTRTVKAWARANGYQVRDRGRVPNEILPHSTPRPDRPQTAVGTVAGARAIGDR
ncbi:MAG TPA: histone-like nucleoid-structuring protein Lsr2 [Micromonosporaceae bacterium]|nr:histone-like nucleoid-structuring protein Lsr2 [Micromonosporaceae bacterium]